MFLSIRQVKNAVLFPIQDRRLLRLFVLRDLHSRYKHSWIGLLWLIIQPIILLSIYTLVFQHILGVRWGAQQSSGVDFALNLYLGLLVFNIFSESLQAAPSVIRVHSNLIRKVILPIRILPSIPVGLAICDAVLGLLIWFLIYLVALGVPPLTAFYFPIVLLPFVLMVTGVCWIVASLSVYMRDVAQITRFVVTGLLFLSPIFFPLQAMPADLQGILSLNPLAIVIEMLRDVLIAGVSPDWDTYIGFFTISLVVYFAGYFWFDLTSDGFVDVL